ncbi:MAG: hypothetical protein IKF01_04610 [Bacilli bacterium]|nr:hypothetical protein [Bacilli bacterium]
MNDANWKSEGTTRFFDTEQHLLYIMRDTFDEIETPKGYYEKKADNVFVGKKKYARKFFCNSVPVEATLYKNVKTKETCYYFPGKPLIKKVKRLVR